MIFDWTIKEVLTYQEKTKSKKEEFIDELKRIIKSSMSEFKTNVVI